MNDQDLNALRTALLLPTERAPTIDELKRALLSYEEVHLLDPSDRELMDPSAFMSAASGGMPIFVGGGTVLPLPKVRSYDDDFGRTVEAFDKAGIAGNLIVRSAPDFFTGGFAIGAPPMPTGWPNPVWTLHVFRQLASDRKYLEAAATSLATWRDGLSQLEELRPAHPQGLVTSNVLPDVAALEWTDGDTNQLLKYVSAARLGSLVKTLGLCTVNGLSPFTSDPGAEAVVRCVGEGIRQACQFDESDPALALHVSLVQSILLREVLDEGILSAMTVDEVVRLRDKAWGRAQRERGRFLQQVSSISKEPLTAEKFEEHVQKEATEYLKAQAEVSHNWGKLKAKTVLTVAGSAMSAGSGLVQTLLPTSLDMALGIGGALAIFGTKVSDQVLDVLKKQREAERMAGAALLAPYRFFVRKSDR